MCVVPSVVSHITVLSISDLWSLNLYNFISIYYLCMGLAIKTQCYNVNTFTLQYILAGSFGVAAGRKRHVGLVGIQSQLYVLIMYLNTYHKQLKHNHIFGHMPVVSGPTVFIYS